MSDQSNFSRRDALRLGLAAGAGMLTAGDAFAQKKRKQQVVKAPPTPPPPPTPQRGGTFRIAIAAGTNNDSLDPATWKNDFMADAGQMFGNTLVSIDAKNVPQPELAESFEGADKARKWVFKLRRGVTFHNGKALTAEDVVATYNYHRDPANKSLARGGLTGIADVKADGPNTVIFTLRDAHADFPYVTSEMHLPIFAAKDGKIDYGTASGTGPYIMDRFKPGWNFDAHRNPNYHRSDAAWFDAIEMQAIFDTPKRMKALLEGKVDYVDKVDTKFIQEFKKQRNLTVTQVPTFDHYTAPMNCQATPFRDVRVRQALKWAINRDELVRNVLSGYGTVANDLPLAPTMRYAAAPSAPYKYDPNMARALLKAAGYNSLKLDLSASEAAFPGAINAANLIKNQARRANININVIAEAPETYYDLAWMKKPWVMSYWNGRATADWMLTTAYADDSPFNDSAWIYPKFNDLLRDARADLNDASRAAKYAEAQRILHEDGGQLVLMFDNYVTAHTTRLEHFDLNSNADHDGGFVYQRWWMKA